MTPTPAQRRPRPTMRELRHEVAAVTADVPRFAAVPLYRRWHQRWGATDEELHGWLRQQPLSTSSWTLGELPRDMTRLVTRLRMLLGIRDRAEDEFWERRPSCSPSATSARQPGRPTATRAVATLGITVASWGPFRRTPRWEGSATHVPGGK
jgi:hypothetical protein